MDEGARYKVRIHFQSWKVGELDKDGNQIFMCDSDTIWDGHNYETMTGQSIQTAKDFADTIGKLGMAGIEAKKKSGK